MITSEPLLVTLVKLVDSIPVPPQPAKRPRGRPKVYSDRLFLKALIVMLVRHLHKVHELLAVLAEPTAEMAAVAGSAHGTRPLPDTAHLGTPPESHAGHVAGPDRLFGVLPGHVDPALGSLHTVELSPSTVRFFWPTARYGTKRPGQRCRTAYVD